MREAFAPSFSHFFNKKYWHIWEINFWKFNEMLTNDVFSFEQPGPRALDKSKCLMIIFHFSHRNHVVTPHLKRLVQMAQRGVTIYVNAHTCFLPMRNFIRFWNYKRSNYNDQFSYMFCPNICSKCHEIAHPCDFLSESCFSFCYILPLPAF